MSDETETDTQENLVSTDSESEFTKICDIKPLEENLDVVFQVVELGEERKIVNRHSQEERRTCEAVIADETAKIIFTLWDEEIDSIKAYESYILKNGYANLYRNGLRLTTGNDGSLEKFDTEFLQLNMLVNRSSEFHEDPRRRRRNRDRYGFSSTRKRKPRRRSNKSFKRW